MKEEKKGRKQRRGMGEDEERKKEREGKIKGGRNEKERQKEDATNNEDEQWNRIEGKREEIWINESTISSSIGRQSTTNPLT